MKTKLKFNERYRERIRLADGSWVLLRLVRSDDKERMKRGFGDLSSQSRYKRFFAAKRALSEAELGYYTELDQDRHFALGIVELNGRGEEGDGLGIARFIRYAKDDACAEVAITVIDRMQGKGIGRIMLEKLLAAAHERNVFRVRFECLPHNLELQRLVRKVCRVVEFKNEDGTLIAEA